MTLKHDDSCFTAKRLIHALLGPDGPFGELDREEDILKLAEQLDVSPDELRDLVTNVRESLTNGQSTR